MNQPKIPHLFVSTVVGGNKITAHHAECMEGLRTLCIERRVNLTVSRDGGTGTDRARNRQVAKFLESGADALLFVDDDVVFDPADVLKMLMTGLPVIGAAYPRKQIEWAAVEAAVKKGVPLAELPKHASGFVFNHLLGGGRVFTELDDFTVAEVGELPTGFLMVRRDALLRFIDQYRDQIEFITDYEPKGAIHHMVFACQRDPSCRRETATRHMQLAAKKQDAEALARAAAEYRATIGDPAGIGRYVTEDYGNTIMFRLMGEPAFLAVDVKLVHIGSYAYQGDLRRALGLTVVDPKTMQAQAHAAPEVAQAAKPVDPGLSHTCAACGVRDPSSYLSETTFRCGQCGHRESAASRGKVLAPAPKRQHVTEMVMGEDGQARPVPVDATEVHPGLSIGGYPPAGSAVADAGFATLVLTSAERRAGGPAEAPKDGDYPGVEVLFLPFWDGPELPDRKKLDDLAACVAEDVRAGKRVLVTCGEGRNRSALVAGLAIHALTGSGGAAIVDRIRGERSRQLKTGVTLSNKAFSDAILALGARAA